MPRPSTTPSCEPTPEVSASTRRTISAAFGDGARLPRLVATSPPLEEELHKLHKEMYRSGTGVVKHPPPPELYTAALLAALPPLMPKQVLHPAGWGQAARLVCTGE